MKHLAMVMACLIMVLTFTGCGMFTEKVTTTYEEAAVVSIQEVIEFRMNADALN